MGSAAEDSTPGPAPVRPGMRRGVDGYFHVVQNVDRLWWLIDPAGQPGWCRAVHGVCAAVVPGDGAMPHDSVARLRAWGFDAVGLGGDGAGRDDGLAYMSVVDFCAAAPVLSGPGLRLPDVFDPVWPEIARRHAGKICAAHIEE